MRKKKQVAKGKIGATKLKRAEDAKIEEAAAADKARVEEADNARKRMQKKAAGLELARKELQRKVRDLQRLQTVLIRREKQLIKLKQELNDIKTLEKLKQKMKAIR